MEAYIRAFEKLEKEEKRKEQYHNVHRDDQPSAGNTTKVCIRCAHASVQLLLASADCCFTIFFAQPGLSMRAEPLILLLCICWTVLIPSSSSFFQCSDSTTSKADSGDGCLSPSHVTPQRRTSR